MKKLTCFVVLCISTLCLACGGGGGDGTDARNVSGTWRGTFTKTSDACSPQSPATITVRHSVNQNEDAVTLVAESSVSFLGNTVGDNGFSVDGSHATIGASNCTDQTRIEYDRIDEDSDPTADVDVTISRSCNGAAACTIVYSGTASRSTSVSPTATPNSNVTPSATVTPGATLTGGCLDMNTHPAAGTYSGNGGCGISDSALTLQNNTVVLSPFGENGATTFSINSSNSASASSANTNLTIAGIAGNSCSVVCSPPGTFTVQCVKEGGSVCVEKF